MMIAKWLKQRREKLERRADIMQLLNEIQAVSGITDTELKQLINEAVNYSGYFNYLKDARNALMMGTSYNDLIQRPAYEWRRISTRGVA